MSLGSKPRTAIAATLTPASKGYGMRVTPRTLADKMQLDRTYTPAQLMVLTQTTIGQVSKALTAGAERGIFRKVGVEWERVK